MVDVLLDCGLLLQELLFHEGPGYRTLTEPDKEEGKDRSLEEFSHRCFTIAATNIGHDLEITSLDVFDMLTVLVFHVREDR